MNNYRYYESALYGATDYDAWFEAASELDRMEGRDLWRLERESEHYDHRLLASRVTILKKLRRQKNYDLLMFRLREELHGNLATWPIPPCTWRPVAAPRSWSMNTWMKSRRH
jgi:hypothetical protein